MAERQIVKYGDPVLREVSEPIKTVNSEIKDLVSDLIDTLKAANGLGLAAVQIGVLLRLFVIDMTAIDPTATLKVYINPEILETSEEELDGMPARAVLHEYDHLEGKLFIDHLTPLAKTMLKGQLKKLAHAS